MKQGAQRLLSLIVSFFRHSRQLGLKETLKRTSHYLGIRIYYSRIKYPLTGYSVTVSEVSLTHSFWERLECGEWELNCIKHMSNVLKPGQIVLDVGAWIGPYTLLFAKLVQDTGRVYAFEPDPKAWRILQRNVRKNGFTNVTIKRLAITNVSGESALQTYSSWGDSMSNLGVRLSIRTPKEIAVKTTTLDEFCRKYNIRPNGIKIDVEGAEALVMEGCWDIIKEYSPWVLLEFHGQFMAQEKRRVIWNNIVDAAKKVTFIAGNSNRYSYGSEVTSIPDCPYCNVFIEY